MTITVKQLTEAFPEMASTSVTIIHQIVNNEFHSSLLGSFDSNDKWIKQCFNRPSDNELEMNALNELLEGYGVEPMRKEGYYINNKYEDFVGFYINMGDTYITTIVYDTLNECYELMSWGDFMEHVENNKDNYT